MNKTKIPWVKNPDGSQGYTWNPITGCLNGCEYCYARRLANTRLKSRYMANDNLAPTRGEGIIPINASSMLDGLDPFYPRFWEDKLYHAWGGKPKGIFVCDMSDLFGIGIPQEWTEKVLNLCRLHNENRYYLLTKQPQNLIKFSPFPDNCWVGVTATNPLMFYNALDNLRHIEASIKYLSIEPFLEKIKIPDAACLSIVNQVIIGALTGTKQELLCLKVAASLALMPYGNKWTLQPKIEWVKEIVVACDKAGIPVFLKDNLHGIVGAKPDSTRWLRQEMPNV